MNCRFCGSKLCDLFLDLGCAPPSNAFLTAAELHSPELYFPLCLFTCRQCFLVQVDEVQRHEELFSNSYVYFSSYSRTWLEHSETFVQAAITRLGLSKDSFVMEVASNDGYLLQYFKARNIPCVGIEPTASTSAVARNLGIESIERFFGKSFAAEFVTTRRSVNLLVANNVLAHVPDINDFVAGICAALAPNGVATIEFPHLMQLVAQRQFDTIYHEHFSYFSLHTVHSIFAAHSLRIWHVEELSTHGGSLRVWVSHTGADYRETPAVRAVLDTEARAGMTGMEYYRGFQLLANSTKNHFLTFLLDCKRNGKLVAGYGAAAKGNTLLNYAGVRPDLLEFVADASPHKQGLYLPGSRIPVMPESQIRLVRPDFVLILPWNLQREIIEQLDYIREWGGKFVTAIPRMVIS